MVIKLYKDLGDTSFLLNPASLYTLILSCLLPSVEYTMNRGTTTVVYQSQESIAESALGSHNLHQFVYFTLYETAPKVLHVVLDPIQLYG